jgi:putative membrane protein (TIGR04086 family)
LPVKARLSPVSWGLVFKTAILIYILTFLLGIGLSLFLPAVFNQGLGDPSTAVQVVAVVSAFLVVVVTGWGAWWATRRLDRAAPLHGLLIGLVVALLSGLLDVGFSRALTLVGLILYGLMVAAGWLGGVLGSRR